MSYTTAQNVKWLSQILYEQVGMQNEMELDSFLSDYLIPQCEGYIDAWVLRRGRAGTLRYFNPHLDQTITLDGNGKSVIMIPPRYGPLLGLGTVTVDGTSISMSDVGVHEFYVERDAGVFNEGVQNIQLIGSYGYVAVPEEIKYVCAQLCSNVMLDLIRRRVAPNLFQSWLLGRGESVEIRTLFSQPVMFTPYMKEQLSRFRVTWIDVG